MLRERATSPAVIVGAIIAAGSLGLYLATIAPSLTFGYRSIGMDGGELLAAAYTVGIPHPPGYPTYMLLLKLFGTIVPIGDFAFRGNLFSALTASASVGLLYWTTYRFCRYLAPDGRRALWIAASALGSAAFAASPIFWSQAVITEVYTLNTLFIGVLLVIASELGLRLQGEAELTEKQVTDRMTAFGLTLGLGLGNHLTLLAVAMPLLAWLWVRLDRSSVVSPWPVAALVIGLSIYLYLPIRAAQNPPVNWGDAGTLDGMAWMLSGRAYQDYVFGVPFDSVPDRLEAWARFVFSQFHPLGIFLGLMGTATLWTKERTFLLASLASIIGLTVYSVSYWTVDFEVLTIPTYLVFSVWVGVGAQRLLSGISDWAGSVREKRWPRAVITTRTFWLLVLVGFAALPATTIVLNYSEQDRRNDRLALELARGIMDSVPDGSLILAADEARTFSLWYLSYVEQRERDVVPISAPLLQFDWYWRDTHERYPDRFPPAPPDDPEQIMSTIMDHAGDDGIYFTYWHPFLAENFDLQSNGAIYHALPKKTAGAE